MASAGQRVLQLLPINEMAPGQQSPYSAISATALDPVYITLPHVPEFVRLGGESALSSSDRAALAAARNGAAVDYPIVRRLKSCALEAAFDEFYEREWRHDTHRAAELRSFVAAQAWWIEDYALFRAIHAHEDERPWTAWAEPLQLRQPDAIDSARRELTRQVVFRQYLQWIANTQWSAARAAARADGVALFGDLPFMVDGDSADVWARQEQFRLDATVGVPPDAFSESGQDWGMPVYRWDAMAIASHSWLRGRARRSADLYDGYRIDHLVGFYRTYARPKDGGPAFFTPESQPEQIALGEHLIGIFREPGAEVIAEDLGTVPTFVRASLARLGVPGLAVLRWERFWDVEGQPFRDPADYPVTSVAVSGTHDTEPLAAWWDLATDEERRLVNELPTIQRVTEGAGLPTASCDATVRDGLLQALCASRSFLSLIPIGDLFGWRTRINEPATISGTNWTFRLPWPSNTLDDQPDMQERRDTLSLWAGRWQRL
jgi:4-alpha-glucanotransferase